MTTNKILKIAFIIGHNSKSQGSSKFGVSEFNFWKQFFSIENVSGLRIRKKASLEQIQIMFFERSFVNRYGYAEEMLKVHKLVDDWGANISVECHYNGFNGRVNGHEVLYYNGSKGGQITAKLFNEGLTKNLKNNDRGNKSISMGSNGAYGLKIGKSKSILIEPFFGQNIKKFLIDGSGRESLILSFEYFLENVKSLRLT